MWRVVLFALAGCAARVADPSPDCSVAECTMVTWVPDAGGIEAGQGLPHIGCRVSVAGCFESVCRTEDLRARCPVERP